MHHATLTLTIILPPCSHQVAEFFQLRWKFEWVRLHGLQRRLTPGILQAVDF